MGIAKVYIVSGLQPGSKVWICAGGLAYKAVVRCLDYFRLSLALMVKGQAVKYRYISSHMFVAMTCSQVKTAEDYCWPPGGSVGGAAIW